MKSKNKIIEKIMDVWELDKIQDRALESDIYYAIEEGIKKGYLRGLKKSRKAIKEIKNEV